jgi:hypothetical protein
LLKEAKITKEFGMAIFTVMMVHPDGDGWNEYLKPHTISLKS